MEKLLGQTSLVVSHPVGKTVRSDTKIPDKIITSCSGVFKTMYASENVPEVLLMDVTLQESRNAFTVLLLHTSWLKSSRSSWFSGYFQQRHIISFQYRRTLLYRRYLRIFSGIN